MEQENKKVLLKNRWNLLANRKQKEWWYTGIYDPQSGVYFSFSLIRLALIDCFHFAVFDPKFPAPFEFEWKGYIDSENPVGRLALCHRSHNCTFRLTGCAEEGWHYELQTPKVSFVFESKPSIPAFTKVDDKFDDQYTLLHFFQNHIHGIVSTPQGKYEIQQGLSYADHCFGTVPRHARWHWIAVQNANCALASLMNYGGLAQCYTEAYFHATEPASHSKHWIRLDQEVSFESRHEHHWDQPWHVTSPDMDIELHIQLRCFSQERIPPLLSFLLKIDHSECFVKASGHIRVDGDWMETGEMYGVLEEHHGIW